MKRITKKEIIYSFLCAVLAVLIFFIIFISSFYIHEFGHASVAIVSSMIEKNNNITINFNYKEVLGLLAPQQTGATIHTQYTLLFNLAGVLTTFIFYLIIGLLVLNLKKVKNNVKSQKFLLFAILTLIAGSLIENLICGTDGLRISCSNYFLLGFSLLFSFIFIFLIAIFFIVYLLRRV